MNDSPSRLLLLGRAPATALARLEGVVQDVAISDTPDVIAAHSWVLLTGEVDLKVADLVSREAVRRPALQVMLDLEHLPSPETIDRLVAARSCHFRRVGGLSAVLISSAPGVQLAAADLVALADALPRAGLPDDEVEILRAALAQSQDQVRDLHQRARSLRERIDRLKDRIATFKRTEAKLRQRARRAEDRLQALESHPAVRAARRLRRVVPGR